MINNFQMNASTPSLQNAVSSIKLLFKTQGKQITDEEIANKINLSYEQFQSYLAHENSIPQGLVDNVLSAYGLKQVVSHSIVQIDINLPAGSQKNKHDSDK
jgi:hypothetical protein